MNKNFDYIDEILKEGFENMSVQPTTEWSTLSAKMNATKTSVDAAATASSSSSGVTQIGSNIIGTITNNIYTIASFFTAAVVSVGLIPSSTELENSYVEQIKQRTEINIIQDSELLTAQTTLSERSNQMELNSIPLEEKPEVVITVKVPVQKTIHKTKTHIIRDTVKVIKPVFTKK